MKYNIYFGACSDKGGIYHYIWENGAYKYVEKLAAPSPMYFDIDGNVLRAILLRPFEGSNESALVDFAIGENGDLSPAGDPVCTKGVEACHLCHFHGNTYAANYGTGSIFATNGVFDAHHGRGVNPDRQEAAHTHFISPSPDGKYMLSCDLGMDTIFTYDENLNVISAARVPDGCGCRHLAYSDDGRFVFCANELKSSVSVFAYEDGKLTLLDTVDCLNHPNPANTAAAIRVNGDYVYVSQRGEDAISVMKWDGAKLKLLDLYSVGGISPRDFIILEDEIIVTNEKSDSVSVLKIKGDALVDTGIRLKMEAPLCAVAIPY